ncbi:jg26502 [Pararge aegeria aegeria]|uniref:Jg26502 protein n=1 Tax=Pararge aegeria aegeria TaxID=348720 RepID=A0A8S4RZS3_9NEOP|nr:jg26502 [Pararge aegeria aegeria]
MLHYSVQLISLSTDKLWAERSQPSRELWDGRKHGSMEHYWKKWHVGSTPKTLSGETNSAQKQVLLPQARAGINHAWAESNNAWSAALGAMGGAGTVLIIAALLFMFRRPKKQEPPLLAPMDLGQNVSFF